jgi:hypothetical protein
MFMTLLDTHVRTQCPDQIRKLAGSGRRQKFIKKLLKRHGCRRVEDLPPGIMLETLEKLYREVPAQNGIDATLRQMLPCAMVFFSSVAQKEARSIPAGESILLKGKSEQDLVTALQTGAYDDDVSMHALIDHEIRSKCWYIETKQPSAPYANSQHVRLIISCPAKDQWACDDNTKRAFVTTAFICKGAAITGSISWRTYCDISSTTGYCDAVSSNMRTRTYEHTMRLLVYAVINHIKSPALKELVEVFRDGDEAPLDQHVAVEADAKHEVQAMDVETGGDNVDDEPRHTSVFRQPTRNNDGPPANVTNLAGLKTGKKRGPLKWRGFVPPKLREYACGKGRKDRKLVLRVGFYRGPPDAPSKSDIAIVNPRSLM